MRRAIGGALTAVLLATACSSSTKPIEVVTAAATKTAEAKTVKVSEIIKTLPKAGRDQAAGADVNADGIFDFGVHRGSMHMKIAGMDATVLVAGTTIYEKFAGAADMLPAGKSWLKIDLDSLGKSMGVPALGDSMRTQQNDPTAGLEMLRGAGPITTVGKEEIRGVQTTHYKTTVDVARSAELAPAAARAAVRQIIDMFGIKSLPVDVWIDSQGRARRIHQVMDYSNAKAVGGLPAGSMPNVDVTVEFYDFGAPAGDAVNVPSADKVADMSALIGGVMSGKGSGTASSESDALAKLLISSVPAGYTQQPDSVGDTGPSDLDKAVRDDGSENARALLTDEGFVAGYQRLWAKDKGHQLILFVYRFKSAAGAQHFADRTWKDTTDNGGQPFAVPGVAGARGAVMHGDTEGASVLGVKGSYVYELVTMGADVPTSVVSGLARDQASRIPG